MSGPPRLRGRAHLLAALLFFSAAFAEAYAPVPRYGQAVALMPNGKILVVGGNNASDTPITSVEILDTTSGSEFVPSGSHAVSATASLTSARSSATITVLPNGNVLVTGGWDGGSARSDAEVYNPLTAAWTVVAGMSSGRFNHTATLLDTGKVLVCGGQTGGAGAVTATCDLFTPATPPATGGTFSATGSMLQARALHTATLLNDGTVWAAGGWNPALSSPFLVTTERYSPVTAQWSSASGLNIERAYHTATLTGDNKVLVAGGYNGQSVVDPTFGPYGQSLGVLNTTEIFDPVGGSIIPGPPLQARVEAHSAALRPEGTVSIYGGMGNIPTTPDDQSITVDAGAFVSAGGGAASAFFDVTAGANAPIYLGATVSGTILDGDIEFLNPVMKFPYSGLTVSFTPSDPNNAATGLRLSLNGATVGCDANQVCGYITGDFPFLNMGQNSFSPTVPIQAVNATQPPVSGTMFFGPSPLSSDTNGGVGNIASASHFTAHLDLPVPSYLAGQTLSSISLTLNTADVATWVETSSYTMTINGGSYSASGPFTVQSDGNGGYYIDVPAATFTNLSGTIQIGSAAPYHLNSPLTIPISIANLAGLTVSMSFTTTAVDLCEPNSAGPPSCGILQPGKGFVVIRSMVFGDNEYFVPKTSQWSFTSPSSNIGSLPGLRQARPGTPATGASAVVTPSGDEFDVGGRTVLSGSLVALAGGLGGSRQDTGTLWAPQGTVAGLNTDPLTHAFHTASLLPNGTILLAGGTDGQNVLASAEVFDPATGNFTLTVSSMAAARERHSASLLPNGRVLLAGGSTSSSGVTGPTNSAELYFPNPGAFRPAAVMISSHSQHVAVSLPNGNVFVAGGYNGLNTVTNTAEVYQSTTNTWIAAAPMPANQQRAVAAAVQLQDGTIMVCGGINQNGLLNSVLIYNPTTNAWAVNGEAMPSALQSHTATLLANGRVLVAGGDNGFGETNSSFIYDPAQADGSRWSATNPLKHARFGHTATLLPNGSVMVSGGVAQLSGNPEANALQSIEFFHPAFDAWTSATSFVNPRSFHTATLAPNGAVYFIGGANGSIGADQSVSFYKKYEAMYFTSQPDQESLTSPSLRQSAITYTTPSPFLPNSSFEVKGLRFRGATEASGGAAGPANTSFNSPRLLLQKADSSSAGGAESGAGFVADLTGAVYAANANQATLDTDLTVTLPAISTLPYGWYMTWIAANDIHTALAPLVQVGPPLPPSPVGSLVGTPISASSVTYTWTSPGGSFDGYDIYSATSGIFIAAVSSMTQTYTQVNLAPNTTEQVMVAAYTLSGDGPLTYSATTYTFPAAPLSLSIASVTFDSLALRWDPNGNTPGTVFEVSESSDGFATSFSTPVPSILELAASSVVISGLVPSTVYYFRLRAFNTAGFPSSGFSNVVSTKTLSSVSGITCGSNKSGDTGTSIQWSWSPGSALSYNVYDAVSGVKLASVPGANANFYETGLAVNSQHSIMVSAVTSSGEGSLSPSATCYTLANLPLPGNPVMTSTSPTSVSLLWTYNGNPNGTVYDVNFASYAFTSSKGTATVSVAVTTVATTGFSANFGGLAPSSYYSASVRAVNGAGVASAPLLMGTTFTLANPQTNLSILGTTPVSVKIGWSQNSNSTMTYYQVTYSADDFVANVATAVPFSSRQNISSATIGGLLTGTTYWVRVQAENEFGQLSGFGAPDIVSTITFNGGGPPGTLTGVLTALGTSRVSGSLADGTFFTMRAPGGAFPSDTSVLISTYDTSGAGHGSPCGANGIANTIGGQATAFSITDNPEFQPARPVYVTATYTPAEIAVPVSQVALSRFDPGSGTCVPLQTTFDPATRTFLAELNHFSLYQLVQISPAASVGTARVFPNPYHAATDGYVTIDEVPPASRVRIMTLRGTTVLDGTADGTGTLTWSGTNGGGRSVASGLYLVVVEAGGNSTVLKLAVVR